MPFLERGASRAADRRSLVGEEGIEPSRPIAGHWILSLFRALYKQKPITWLRVASYDTSLRRAKTCAPPCCREPPGTNGTCRFPKGTVGVSYLYHGSNRRFPIGASHSQLPDTPRSRAQGLPRASSRAALNGYRPGYVGLEETPDQDSAAGDWEPQRITDGRMNAAIRLHWAWYRQPLLENSPAPRCPAVAASTLSIPLDWAEPRQRGSTSHTSGADTARPAYRREPPMHFAQLS
jgi:hypothetical protein